jgi:hypothetical protein
MFRPLLTCLACAALLSACASTKKQVPPPPVPTLSALMVEAELALASGQRDEALLTLAAATARYPHDKAGWLRMAQVQFDSHRYGEAITSAQNVVERDPDDIVGHSLLAASGLRVSSKALSDLTEKNNLNGSVRAEAQDLARLVRSSIGTDIIVPHPKARPEKPMLQQGGNAGPVPLSELPH